MSVQTTAVHRRAAQPPLLVRHRIVTLAASLTAAMFALALLLAVGTSTANAQTADGLTVSASTIFTPDPANERIDVQATYVMTNVQPDEVLNGSVRSYYFTKWVIAMPANVTDFVATSNNLPLATEINDDPDSDHIVFGSISLPFNLDYEESVTIDVSYTIPGGAPRGEGAVARVNDSFLSFSVWTSGDPGMTDVTIEIPDGFAMTLQGDLDELTMVTRDGQSFYEAQDLEEPREFFGQIYGRNDAGLITDYAELPDARATVRAWPDDPEWVSFVVDAIEDGVPVMEDLTGIDWPAGDIEVIETVTPYLYGYGGWFNAQSGLIEIGENLERDLILHELAHAWFNDDLIEGRWITEGLAEEFASRVIEATSSEQLAPDTPALADPLRVQLANWASPWSLNEESAFAYEQFHYNASWWVMRQISDEIGLDALSAVLVSLQNDEIAYPGDGPIEQTLTPTRWTHFFDLLDHQAGATGLENLFGTYVLAESDVGMLDRRTSTLERYDELTATAQTWAAPLVVRRALSEWNFDDADKHIELAAEIVVLRDQADSLAAELDVIREHNGENAFETAMSQRDLEAARGEESAEFVALTDLAEDRAELQQSAIGLNASLAFDTMTISDAKQDVRSQASALGTVSELRTQVAVRADDLGILPPAWPQQSGATDFGAAASLAQARLTTLFAIEEATTATKEPRSFVERVGLWGSNVDATLENARDAFEADELDDALAASGQTETMLAAAGRAGTRRLIWAGALLTIAALASLWLRHRTRQPR